MYGIEERWVSVAGAVEKIKNAIANSNPFSLVRIQDGEYRFIEYQNVPLTDLEQIIWVHFGRQPFPDRYVKFISEGVIAAAKNADVIGLFRGPLVLSPEHGEYHRLLYSAVSRQLINDKANIVDADIHNSLLVDQLFSEFLQDLPFLGLITCRHVESEVAKKFNIAEVKTYYIPEQYQFANNIIDFYNNKPHFPDAFAQICNTIQVPFKGAVFLVGAGMLGKIYCDEIKRKGGIAIDVGSVFDAWDGVYSRTQFSRGFIFNEISPELRIRDRRGMLPPETKISNVKVLKIDSNSKVYLDNANVNEFKNDAFKIEKPVNVGIGKINGSIRASFNNKNELINYINEYPYGSSVINSKLAIEVKSDENTLINLEDNKTIIDNQLLLSKFEDLGEENISGTVYASSEFTDCIDEFAGGEVFIEPSILPINISTDEFWVYCDYEVIRPVKGNEFATALTLELGDKKTTIVIRSGLNSAAQSAIIYGSEHAIDFVRYDFGDSRRHKVAISFRNNYIVAASNGHVFQPKGASINSQNIAKISIGSYITGSHVLGGRIHSLAIGNGQISNSDLEAITS